MIESLSFFGVKIFCCYKKLSNIFFCSLFIDYIYLFHYSWIEYSKFAANVLFAYPCIWSNDIETSKRCISDLCSWLYHIAISYLWIIDVAFDTKNVVTSYFHDVIILWCWFEHDDSSLFDDVVISKDYFEVLIFFLADDRASRIDDAALTEDYISYDLVETEIENIGFFHFLKISII